MLFILQITYVYDRISSTKTNLCGAVMKVWQYVVAGGDGNTTLFGVNIFKYDWINTGEKVEVTDPLYGQKHLFSVYKEKGK